jgi:hypothetical protein
MWNCSVLISGQFLSMCSMSIVSSMLMYVCRVSKMCCGVNLVLPFLKILYSIVMKEKFQQTAVTKFSIFKLSFPKCQNNRFIGILFQTKAQFAEDHKLNLTFIKINSLTAFAEIRYRRVSEICILLLPFYN